MVILHAFAALLAGLLTMSLLVFATSRLMARSMPQRPDMKNSPAPGTVLMNLASLFVAGGAGGYVTAWIAAGNPLLHVLVLGIIALVLAALSALQARGTQPIPYQLAQVAVAPIGILAGGLIRLRVLGLL